MYSNAKSNDLDLSFPIYNKKTWFHYISRTSSIHHPYKTVAKRTTSDGPIYKLRRGLVSIATCDLSDTSSEISSEDKQNSEECGKIDEIKFHSKVLV